MVERLDTKSGRCRFESGPHRQSTLQNNHPKGGEMKIIVGMEDRIAIRFAEEVFAARIVSQNDECLTFQVPEGGTRLVIFFSYKTGEAKKSVSIKVGSCDYPIPNWVEKTGGTKDKVILVLNQELYYKASANALNILGILKRETRPYQVDSRFAGRGGYIAYMILPTEKVLFEPLASWATELNPPSVSYGTTDAANVFEFLQTLKAAWRLGLSATFDSYEGAHCIGDYMERILLPSLDIVSSQLDPQDLGASFDDKFTKVVSSKDVLSAFNKAKLKYIAATAAQLADTSFGEWYRRAIAQIGIRIKDLLSITTPFSLLSSEDVLKRTDIWTMSAADYALKLERAAGHPVVVLHDPSGKPVKYDAFGYKLYVETIGQLHEQGWWLGGAGIYWANYSRGGKETIVMTIKDSEAGNVHLLARPFMEGEKSGLYIIPVGLFRLHTLGQDEDASIDPWVFLELLERWGEEKSREIVQIIWEAMEVPLLPEHVGRKTVATVSLDGVEIQVRN